MAKSRIYKRTRNGVTRYYGDFRDYADVGGRREALIAGGTSAATTDPALAETLMLRRLRAVERSLSTPVRHSWELGPVNTKGRFVVYGGYENHRVPISSDRGLLSASARQCEHLQSRSA